RRALALPRSAPPASGVDASDPPLSTMFGVVTLLPGFSLSKGAPGGATDSAAFWRSSRCREISAWHERWRRSGTFGACQSRRHRLGMFLPRGGETSLRGPIPAGVAIDPGHVPDRAALSFRRGRGRERDR